MPKCAGLERRYDEWGFGFEDISNGDIEHDDTDKKGGGESTELKGG